MLEKEVRRNILKILYEDSMKESPKDFSSEEFVEMIPGATAKQVERILKDMYANGYLEFAVFYDQSGGVVNGLTSQALSFYEEHYLSDGEVKGVANERTEGSKLGRAQITPNNLIQRLVLGDIKVSQGLMLCNVMYKDLLSDETIRWISYELDHYERAETIPKYRILDCSIKARISRPFFGSNDVELDTSFINRQLLNTDKSYASPNKMLIRQSLESIEDSLQDSGLTAQMELSQGQVNLLLRYYTYPSDCKVEKMYQECKVEQLRNIVSSVRNRLISIIQDLCNRQMPEQKRGNEKSSKRVFVSYGWEDDEHCAWVREMANRLSSLFDVMIDVRQPLGTELNVFMEQIITKADRVLLILTPKYKEKADTRQNGVGYESVLISSELYRNQGTTKFIPIIRKGEVSESYPLYLGTRKGLDMRDDSLYEERLAELIEDINCN